jgi:hypothetical protein
MKMCPNINPPNSIWSTIIIGDKALEKINSSYTRCEDDLVRWYEDRYANGVAGFETSESVAIQVGTKARTTPSFKEHFSPIFTKHLNSSCEERLAEGYIGKLVMQDAD